MEANLIYFIDFDKYSDCVELFSKKFAKRYPTLKFKYNKIEYSIFHNRLFSVNFLREKDIILKEIEIYVSWIKIPYLSYIFFKTNLKYFKEINFNTDYFLICRICFTIVIVYYH